MIIAGADSGWTEVFDTPFHQRCWPAPEEMVAHVALANAQAGMHTTVASADAEPAVRAMIERALADVPDGVTARLRGSFLGVYLTTGTGSSAATDIVVSPEGAFLGLAIVFDLDVLAHAGANDWASWRERSAFMIDADQPGAPTLEVRIADPADDQIGHAVAFLLLHELGHALSAGRAFVPDWWTPLPDHVDASGYAFLSLSWRIDAQRRIVPLDADDFPLRASVAHYDLGPRLPAERMIEVYDALERTSFATLYGATSVHEDFAESFACHVHAVRLGRPLDVTIRRHGDTVRHWRPDWRGPRYAAKLAFFERLLGPA